jgi:hypothetical protein
MSPAWLERETPASERPQTQALDSAATGIGIIFLNTSTYINFSFYVWSSFLTTEKSATTG